MRRSRGTSNGVPRGSARHADRRGRRGRSPPGNGGRSPDATTSTAAYRAGSWRNFLRSASVAQRKRRPWKRTPNRGSPGSLAFRSSWATGQLPPFTRHVPLGIATKQVERDQVGEPVEPTLVGHGVLGLSLNQPLVGDQAHRTVAGKGELRLVLGLGGFDLRPASRTFACLRPSGDRLPRPVPGEGLLQKQGQLVRAQIALVNGTAPLEKEPRSPSRAAPRARSPRPAPH